MYVLELENCGLEAVDVCACVRVCVYVFTQVSPDFQDLWVGQSAWYSYSSMLRIFKHYDFQIQNPGTLHTYTHTHTHTNTQCVLIVHSYSGPQAAL